MIKPLGVRDRVTVLPPFDKDDFLVQMQRHAWVAEILPGDSPDSAVYMLHLDGAHPPDRKFGPFPATRLRAGWDTRGSDG